MTGNILVPVLYGSAAILFAVLLERVHREVTMVKVEIQEALNSVLAAVARLAAQPAPAPVLSPEDTAALAQIKSAADTIAPVAQ